MTMNPALELGRKHHQSSFLAKQLFNNIRALKTYVSGTPEHITFN